MLKTYNIGGAQIAKIRVKKNWGIVRPKNIIEMLAEEQGHKILYLPPYMPDWCASELGWARIKNWVAKHNTSFKIHDIKTNLLPRAYCLVDQEFCRNVFNHINAEIQIFYNENIH